MRGVLFRMRDEFFVDRVHHATLDPDDDGLVTYVADNNAVEYSSRHYGAFLGCFTAPLAEDGVDARDVAPYLPDPCGVLKLAVGALKPQIENLLSEDVELPGELII